MKIKYLREEKNSTQEEIANLIGVKRYTYAKWEQGRAEPSIEDLIKLADVFNCSIDYMLERENDFGIIEQKNDLTNTENELIKLFRTLNEHDKYKALGFIQALAY